MTRKKDQGAYQKKKQRQAAKVRRQVNKLTEGSILKSLISLSVPIIFANILQTAYQLIDTFWVGRLGSVAVAAVSLSFPIIFLLISLGGGFAIAGTILVAQYKGKNEQKSIDHVSTQTLLVVFLVSIMLSTLGFFLAPYLVSLMGAEAAVFSSALSYIQVSFIGVIFVFTYMIFQSLMRGVGDVKTPMYIVLGTVLLNLILDPLFIFGYGNSIPGFGVTGAAIATIITQGLASVVGIFILWKGKHNIQLHLKDLKPDIALIKKMFFLGVPAAVEQATRALAMMLMTLVVASFGTFTIAAYGIGTRVLGFILIPAMGLSMATATLVGQNIGAGKADRAEKIAKLSTTLGFITLTIVGVIFFLFAKYITILFIPGEAETILKGTYFIKAMSLSFGFLGAQMVLTGIFRGAGNTVLAMLIALVALWVLRFPLVYILSFHTTLREAGIWIAFPISNIIAAIIAFMCFQRGTWKHKKLTEEIKLSEATAEEALVETGSNL